MLQTLVVPPIRVRYYSLQSFNHLPTTRLLLLLLLLLYHHHYYYYYHHHHHHHHHHHSTVTRLMAGRSGVRIPAGADFLCSLNRPERLWGPPSLRVNVRTIPGSYPCGGKRFVSSTPVQKGPRTQTASRTMGKVKVKQSHYRPGVAQRVLGS
jgi:hypothetical protein